MLPGLLRGPLVWQQREVWTKSEYNTRISNVEEDMDNQTVTLTIPGDLYQRLELLAAASNITLEEQILKVISSGLYNEESGLPPEFAAVLASLEAGGDIEALRFAAQPNSPRMEAALQDMREQVKNPNMNPAARRKMEEILYQYEMKDQLRQKAAELLKQREGNIH
jgi:hypothetical protein